MSPNRVHVGYVLSRNSYLRLAGGLVGAAAGLAIILVYVPLKHPVVTFFSWVHGLGPGGAVMYALVYIAGTVFLIPGTALTAGAGLLYGPVIGTLIVSPASVLGATLSFLTARHFARDWVESKIQRYPKFNAVDRAIEKNGFKVIFLLRLQPIFIPFALLNYALGLTSVPLRDYVVASWLGMLPATILYVYLGSALHNISDLVAGRLPQSGIWGRGLFWGGLVAAALLVWLLGRIARKALDEQLEEAPSARKDNELNVPT